MKTALFNTLKTRLAAMCCKVFEQSREQIFCRAPALCGVYTQRFAWLMGFVVSDDGEPQLPA